MLWFCKMFNAQHVHDPIWCKKVSSKIKVWRIRDAIQISEPFQYSISDESYGSYSIISFTLSQIIFSFLQIISPHDKGISSNIEANLEPWKHSWDTSILNSSSLLHDPYDDIFSSYMLDVEKLCFFRWVHLTVSCSWSCYDEWRLIIWISLLQFSSDLSKQQKLAET